MTVDKSPRRLILDLAERGISLRASGDKLAFTAPRGVLTEDQRDAGQQEHQPDPPGRRAHHRPHQVLENPPHTLQETPGSIRTDHHRRTRTLCLQNHPLNNLHYSHNQESAAILLTVIHDF